MKLKQDHVKEMAKIGTNLSTSRTKAAELERQLSQAQRELTTAKAASDEKLREEANNARRESRKLRLELEALQADNVYLRGCLKNGQNKTPSQGNVASVRSEAARIDRSSVHPLSRRASAVTSSYEPYPDNALNDEVRERDPEDLRNSALNMLRASGWRNKNGRRYSAASDYSDLQPDSVAQSSGQLTNGVGCRPVRSIRRRSTIAEVFLLGTSNTVVQNAEDGIKLPPLVPDNDGCLPPVPTTIPPIPRRVHCRESASW
jgi:hypothetical protein